MHIGTAIGRTIRGTWKAWGEWCPDVECETQAGARRCANFGKIDNMLALERLYRTKGKALSDDEITAIVGPVDPICPTCLGEGWVGEESGRPWSQGPDEAGAPCPTCQPEAAKRMEE